MRAQSSGSSREGRGESAPTPQEKIIYFLNIISTIYNKNFIFFPAKSNLSIETSILGDTGDIFLGKT